MRHSPLEERFERSVQAEADRLHAAVNAAARPGLAQTAPLKPAVAWIAYGPDGAEACVRIAADLGSPAAEYAAIRRGVGVMDAVHRGTIRVTGADRVAFLQRMVTQDLKGLAAGGVRESFWLNRKGRVQADLLMAEFGDALLLDVDRFAAASTVTELQGFLFSEDVQLSDVTETLGRMALHGAATLQLLLSLGMPAGALESDLSCAVFTTPAGAVHAARRDQTGVPGVELFVPVEHLPALFDAVTAAGPSMTQPVRPVGWHAWNVARVEAGTPLFLVDFGREALPHETGSWRVA